MPAGHHQITMRYRTAGLDVAVPVTRAGFGVWLLALVAGMAWAGRVPKAPKGERS
jgi:hypothetical protein